MYATHLVCKGCGAEHPLDARFACDRCFGPLEAAYDVEASPEGVAYLLQAGPSGRIRRIAPDGSVTTVSR